MNLGSVISSLLQALAKGFWILVQFLAVVVLGLLVALVWVLPWLIRAASIVAWIGGAYLAGETINAIYGQYSDPLPLLALWVIPAILAAAVPVWLFYKGLLAHIWGGFFVFGFLCWGFDRGSFRLLTHWDHADLFFRVAPVLLLTAFIIFISIRFKFMRSAQHDQDFAPDAEGQTGGPADGRPMVADAGQPDGQLSNSN